MRGFKTGQDKRYQELQALEQEETGRAARKTELMKRRKLRRDQQVKDAVALFWSRFGELRLDGEFLSYDVYITFHTKIAQALGVFDGENFDPDEARSDSRPTRI